MQHNAAKHLDVEEAVPDAALNGIAHGGKRLRQQCIERFTRLQTAAKFGGLVGEFCGGKRREVGFERCDLLDNRLLAGDFTFRVVEEALEYA